MGGRTTWVARAVVALLAVLGLTGAFAGCEPARNCSSITSTYADKPVKNMSQANAEQAVWCLANAERAKAGLPAFSASSVLDGTARAHAQDAVNRKWWVDGADPHTNPDGKGPGDRMRAAGWCPSPTYYRTAENVYWGWGTPLQTPRSAITWWMQSPGHRANILSTELKELGVGVVLGAPRPGTYPDAAVFVQNFGLCR